MADERYSDGVLKLRLEYIDKEFERVHKTVNGLPSDVAEIKATQRIHGRKLEGIEQTTADVAEIKTTQRWQGEKLVTIEQTLTGGRWSKATVIPLVFGLCGIVLMFGTLALTLVSLL